MRAFPPCRVLSAWTAYRANEGRKSRFRHLTWIHQSHPDLWMHSHTPIPRQCRPFIVRYIRQPAEVVCVCAGYTCVCAGYTHYTLVRHATSLRMTRNYIKYSLQCVSLAIPAISGGVNGRCRAHAVICKTAPARWKKKIMKRYLLFRFLHGNCFFILFTGKSSGYLLPTASTAAVYCTAATGTRS